MTGFGDVVVALAAGIFLGAGLFDVLPQAVHNLGLVSALFWAAAGLFLWWLQKKVLQRFNKPDLPPLVASALWLHSFLEGVVIGLAFGISQTFGLLVLAGMILHLLPEFFAAVALMRGAGSKSRASIAVTLTGFLILFSSFGLTYWILPSFGNALPVAIAMSAGAFVYIGGVSFWRRRSLKNTVALFAGLSIVILQSIS